MRFWQHWTGTKRSRRREEQLSFALNVFLLGLVAHGSWANRRTILNLADETVDHIPKISPLQIDGAPHWAHLTVLFN